MELLRYLYGFLIFAGLVVLYITMYLLNKKVKKPEGCEDVGCSNCTMTSCALNTTEEEI